MGLELPFPLCRVQLDLRVNNTRSHSKLNSTLIIQMVTYLLEDCGLRLVLLVCNQIWSMKDILVLRSLQNTFRRYIVLLSTMYCVYILWDLGIKLMHAVRSLAL